MRIDKDTLNYLNAGKPDQKPKKKNKFNAEQIQIGKYIFRSKKEGRRYMNLIMMQQVGMISNLKVDSLKIKEIKPFILQEGFRHKSWDKKIIAIKYTPDFSYNHDEKLIFEDCKGLRTASYKIKIKMLLNMYPDINFIET